MQRRDGSLFNSYIKLSDDGKTIEVVNAPAMKNQGSQIGGQTQSNYEPQHSDSSIISGSIGLFDLPADGGDDSEESLFRNRMQRQQKKKKGRSM